MAVVFRGLFVKGSLDGMNTIEGNRSGDPMRTACPDLTISLQGAHWLPLERKVELVQAIRTWLKAKCFEGSKQGSFLYNFEADPAHG